MSFSKKKNSTATPSSNSEPLSGTLREGCSVIKPIIGFELSRLTFANWNYAYISDFYRYYYIQDWVWDDGLWWAYMEVDPLASFKAGIGASSCYVLRSASEYDNKIADSIYPTRSETFTVQTVQVDTRDSWEKTFGSGTYVVGVLGGGTGNGAVSYYAMSPSQMASFRAALMSDIDSLIGTTEITSELAKALFNPFQYLVSALWFPFSISGGSSQSIKLGWWDTGVSASVLSNMVNVSDTFTTVYTMPSGSYAPGETLQHWMLLEPYSEYTLFCPPYGAMKLDSRIVAKNVGAISGGGVQLELIEVIDYISGMAYLDVRIGGVTVAYKQAMIGVNTILSQSTQDIVGGGINFLQGASAIANNFASGGLYGIITGNNTVSALGQIYDGAKAFV